MNIGIAKIILFVILVWLIPNVSEIIIRSDLNAVSPKVIGEYKNMKIISSYSFSTFLTFKKIRLSLTFLIIRLFYFQHF